MPPQTAGNARRDGIDTPSVRAGQLTLHTTAQSWIMRTRTAQILYAYWNAMRGDRLAPRRFEIEPARIADILPETFILERAERAGLRYRLAGTRICENFGTEFRGRSFFEGWASGDLGAVGECADRVLHEGGVGLLSIEALTAGGRGAEFEVLLLPLTHTRDDVERVLGAITAMSDEPWLGAEPLVERRLLAHEVIWPEGRPHALAERINRQAPFGSHVRRARIVRADRRQFRVYDGGLATGAEPE